MKCELRSEPLIKNCAECEGLQERRAKGVIVSFSQRDEACDDPRPGTKVRSTTR
jgi:hypothetical protein